MSEVNVISRVQMIVVNPTTRSVSVINMGPQGPGGIPGQTGLRGEVWFTGAGAPNTISGALLGDWYLNSTNGDYYDLTTLPSTWTLRGNLKGPAGAAGSGVPVGGTTGQYLSKTSAADFATQWSSFVAATETVKGVVELADSTDMILDNATNAITPAILSAAMKSGFGGGGNGHYITQQVNSKNGTTYTMAVADAGCITRFTNAAAVAVSLPAGVFFVGTCLDLIQTGTGTVTITPAATVTINGSTSPVTLAPNAPVMLKQIASNVWMMNPGTLDSLANVSAPTAADGQVLRYNAATGLWTPGTGGTGSGLPPGGVIYNLLVKASSTDGDAVWSSVPQVSSLTADAISIRDTVGTSIPRLIFGNGDGNNGTSPNPYDYTWQLLGDKLDLLSSRFITKPVVSFKRISNTEVEHGFANWFISDNDDGYMRWFNGADRTNAEMFLDASGNGGVKGNWTVSGGLMAPWYTETPYLQAAAGTALVIRATSYAEIQAAGGFGAQQVGVSVGNQYGVGAGPTVSLYAYPNGNQYYQRQLTLNKVGGAGECGLAFINNTTGNIGCFQLHNDGTPYIGFLNSANSAYIKSYASAFTVNSSRRFKAEIKRLRSKRNNFALNIINHVAPVRYRDLQHEMAMEVLAPYPDGSPREPVQVEPNYRFGLIAEEVEEAAPELVSHTPDHGPGIDLSGLIGVLWQAVRELSNRVSELEGATT